MWKVAFSTVENHRHHRWSGGNEGRTKWEWRVLGERENYGDDNDEKGGESEVDDGDERKRVSDDGDESDEGGSQEREKSDEAEKWEGVRKRCDDNDDYIYIKAFN